MTTTDMPPTEQPPSAAARPRLLRRSRGDRFAAGVCGGLGEYFGVDPILFRVLFATAALFGGSGVLAYLIAWALIPEAGTEHAPVDDWVHELRRHRVPVWAVVIGVGLVLWLAAFSWWSSGPFVPVVAVVVLLVIALGRRDWQARSPSAWLHEAKCAARDRRRRALPIKIATLGPMAVVLVVLAAVDAVTGVPIAAYFWAVLGFVAVGLLVGVVLRRTPWSIATLLPLALAGVLAFAGSQAALHDGVGQKTWGPSHLASHYRLGVGQLTLDLRHLSATTTAQTARVTVGAGEAQILLPADAAIEVQADVHIGQIEFRGHGDGLLSSQNTGVGAHENFLPPDDARGPHIVVDVHVADGQVIVERQ